jgi:hypothetical protein
MGLFSDVVADSRPRVIPGGPAIPAKGTGPVAVSSDQRDQERGTMISGVEERTAESASVSREIQPDPGRAQDAEPRQGADPSPLKASAAAVSRTVVGVFRDLKGKRSTEEGTTDGHDKDFGRNEDELLGERNRQESTTNGLHVDLDAHASVPSLSGQTAVSSGASFKREAELSGNTDSRRTNHLSNVSHGELDNGTAVLDGRQSPGKAPLPPEPKAVVPSAVKSAEALPPVKQAVAAEGRRERVFDSIEKAPTATTSPLIVTAEPGRPSPPAPLPASHPDPREGGEARAPASSPSVETRERGGGGRAQTPSVAVSPSPGVRSAGHERLLVNLAVPRREAPREPAGPRVQIGRLEVIVMAPAPAAPVAPSAAPSPKPGALASRRYLRSL